MSLHIIFYIKTTESTRKFQHAGNQETLWYKKKHGTKQFRVFLYTYPEEVDENTRCIKMHESTWCCFLCRNFSWSYAYYTLVVSYISDLWLLFVSCIHAIATLGLLPALNQGITLRRTVEDGLCCSSSAIQTRLGLSSLLEEWSEIPIVLLFFCVVGYPPNWGKWPRYIDR